MLCPACPSSLISPLSPPFTSTWTSVPLKSLLAFCLGCSLGVQYHLRLCNVFAPVSPWMTSFPSEYLKYLWNKQLFSFGCRRWGYRKLAWKANANRKSGCNYQTHWEPDRDQQTAHTKIPYWRLASNQHHWCRDDFSAYLRSWRQGRQTLLPAFLSKYMGFVLYSDIHGWTNYLVVCHLIKVISNNVGFTFSFTMFDI